MDTNTASAPTKLAEPFAGGFYAGRIRIGEQLFAIVVAPKGEGEHDDIRWNKSTKKVDGALSFFDGLANSEAMAEAGSDLAKWARNLRIGDFDGWYLPSRDELEILYRAFKPTGEENACWRGDNPSSIPVGYAYSLDAPAQTTVEPFKDGGVEAFVDTWYWSSTQYAGHESFAWFQTFSYGDQDFGPKDYELRARAVRRLKI